MVEVAGGWVVRQPTLMEGTSSREQQPAGNRCTGLDDELRVLPAAPKAAAEPAVEPDSLAGRVAAIYQKHLDNAPDDTPEQVKNQWREKIARPGRYTGLYEDENPQGLKVGDRVYFGESVSTVTAIQKTEATRYPGGYAVHLVADKNYGGWTDIGDVEKASELESIGTDGSETTTDGAEGVNVDTPQADDTEIAPTFDIVDHVTSESLGSLMKSYRVPPTGPM